MNQQNFPDIERAQNAQSKLHTGIGLTFIVLIFGCLLTSFTHNSEKTKNNITELRTQVSESLKSPEVNSPEVNLEIDQVTEAPEIMGPPDLIFFESQKIAKSFDPTLMEFYQGPIDIELYKFEEIIVKSLPFVLRKKARKFVKDIVKTSLHYELDPLWVFSVIWTESHFRQFVVSNKDARGLMQILPTTGLFVLSRENIELSELDKRKKLSEQLLGNHRLNLELGVLYLRHLLNDVFNGNFRLATVAYNMGPNGVKRRLQKGLPVGVRNSYLDKVSTRYKILKKPFVKEYLANKALSDNLYTVVGTDLAKKI